MFIYHDAFNTNKEEVADLKDRYKTGRVGDIEVKQKLVVAINNFLDPIRERRAKFESNPKLVDELLHEGTKNIVGAPRIELGLRPPEGRVLPVYYAPHS